MIISLNSTFINSLLLACPLILIATGGILSTRSGIANFAFDGVMCAGAAIYCIVMAEFKKNLGFGALFIALLAAAAVGILFSLLFSFATITCQANQIFVSMALNYLGYGLALVLPFAIFNNNSLTIAAVYIKMNPWIAIIITLLVVYFFAIFLFLTKYGLYLRAVGENATVAAFSYINVRKIRYLVSMISFGLCSFGGGLIVYIFPNLFIMNNNFSGLGFLIISLWMIGNNKFFWTTLICLVFSFVYQLSLDLQITSSFTQSLPGWFLGMIPYIATLLFLIFFRFDTTIPNHWGQPYNKTGHGK